MPTNIFKKKKNFAIRIKNPIMFNKIILFNYIIKKIMTIN